MRILLDTNILLSAALFPNGTAAKAYNKIDSLNKFISTAATSFEIIPTPTDNVPDELKIRDVKDRPILRAAKIAKVDILLTGDKDFLESGINTPKIVNPSQFLSIT